MFCEQTREVGDKYGLKLKPLVSIGILQRISRRNHAHTLLSCFTAEFSIFIDVKTT
jgi:hypothetical protein